MFFFGSPQSTLYLFITDYAVAQTTRIPGRVKSKQWENLLRPTFQMSIKFDLLKLFRYFFSKIAHTFRLFSFLKSGVKFTSGVAVIAFRWNCQNL